MRAPRETVIIRRPVMVERIPDGTPIELDPGTMGQITQALGGNFTLLVDGQLVRLKGSDADAIGKEPPTAAADRTMPTTPTWKSASGARCAPATTRRSRSTSSSWAWSTRAASRPWTTGATSVDIQMTLTAPGCGMGDAIADEVADKVLALEGVGEVKVDMVFDPPWDRSRMSEAAQLALGV